MKTTLRKVGLFAVDLVELYLPALAFVVLFVSFTIQIVSRYFFRPLTWPEELSLLCFVWVALLGSLYAKRSSSHVAFAMVYDALKPRGQARMRVAGDILLAAAFALALKPCWEYVSAMGYRKSDVLGIPIDWAFAPFVVFLLDMTARLVIDLVRDLRDLRGLRDSRKGGLS